MSTTNTNTTDTRPMTEIIAVRAIQAELALTMLYTQMVYDSLTTMGLQEAQRRVREWAQRTGASLQDLARTQAVAVRRDAEDDLSWIGETTGEQRGPGDLDEVLEEAASGK